MTYEQLDKIVNQEIGYVCDNIKTLCKRFSIPQSKVSKLLGFQGAYLSHALAKKKLSVNVLLKVMHYFGVSLTTLKCKNTEFNKKLNDEDFRKQIREHIEQFDIQI